MVRCSISEYVLAGVLTFIFINARSQNYIAGQKYFGHRSFIEYHCGTLPVILSAPHGGYERPSDIPDRNCDVCTNVNDAFTRELSLEIADALFQLTGCHPHLVINNLHRSKLDANRNLWEATLGNPDAIKAWNDFHDFILYAKSESHKSFGKGLYLDIHGHGHSIQRLELGYLLYEDELLLSDSVLNTSRFIGYSSIKNLVNHNRNSLTHAELLRGLQSFGHMTDLSGYPSVPSFQNPFPRISEPYFSGGYNVAQHGSNNGGTIDGIQIECNQNVRFDVNKRKEFAVRLAEVIMKYINLHYFETPDNYSCTSGLFPSDFEYERQLIFPNPSSERLYLQIQKMHLPVYATITTTAGIVVFQSEISENEIDISVLNEGIYYLHINKGTNKSVSRFIKL